MTMTLMMMTTMTTTVPRMVAMTMTTIAERNASSRRQAVSGACLWIHPQRSAYES